MKVEVEFRDFMSRKETLQALKIVTVAAERLLHRMTDRDLANLNNAGAALMALAEDERARRGPRSIENVRPALIAGPENERDTRRAE